MSFELSREYEDSWKRINAATRRRKLIWALEGAFFLVIALLLVVL